VKFTAALRLEGKKFGSSAYNGGLGVYLASPRSDSCGVLFFEFQVAKFESWAKHELKFHLLHLRASVGNASTRNKVLGLYGDLYSSIVI